ncbi:hypothetical protein KSS87_021091 [Heliosperma pusillum]|nr:hypothetical protein KSS87_021091 [Heliosperma pusillum]
MALGRLQRCCATQHKFAQPSPLSVDPKQQFAHKLSIRNRNPIRSITNPINNRPPWSTHCSAPTPITSLEVCVVRCFDRICRENVAHNETLVFIGVYRSGRGDFDGGGGFLGVSCGGYGGREGGFKSGTEKLCYGSQRQWFGAGGRVVGAATGTVECSYGDKQWKPLRCVNVVMVLVNLCAETTKEGYADCAANDHGNVHSTRKGDLLEESAIPKKTKKPPSDNTPTKKAQTEKMPKATTEKPVIESKEAPTKKAPSEKASKGPKATQTPTKKVLPTEKVQTKKVSKPPAKETKKAVKASTHQTNNAEETGEKKVPKPLKEKALKVPAEKAPKEPVPKLSAQKLHMLPKITKASTDKEAIGKTAKLPSNFTVTKDVTPLKTAAKKMPTEKTPIKQTETRKSDQQQTKKALKTPSKTPEKKVVTTPVKKVEPSNVVSAKKKSAPKKTISKPAEKETTEIKKAVPKGGKKVTTAKAIPTKVLSKKKVTETKKKKTTAAKKRPRNKVTISDNETDEDYDESDESGSESKMTIKKAKTEKGLMLVKSVKEIKAEEEEVISKKPDKYNNRCKAQSLVDVMAKLSGQRKRAVREIGFGGLLHMKITVVPKGLIDLLIEAFDDESYKVTVSDTKEFVLSHFDVHDMFKLPIEGNDVELTTTGRSALTEDTVLKQKWRKKFNINGNENIPLNMVSKWFTDNKGACGDEFKQVFVLYALSTFLSPTPKYSVDFKLLKAVEDVKKIKQYNWSKYVMEKLAEGIRALKKGGKNLCGCIVVLIIAYLHRFEFNGEIQPTELPLIKHWSDTKLLKRVNEEARLGYLGDGDMTETDYPIYDEGRDCILMEKFPGIETDDELKQKALDDTHLMLLMIKRDSDLVHQSILQRLAVFETKKAGKSVIKPIYRSYTDDVVRKAEALKRRANDFPVFTSSKSSKKLKAFPSPKVRKTTAVGDSERSNSIVSEVLEDLKSKKYHHFAVEDEIKDDDNAEDKTGESTEDEGDGEEDNDDNDDNDDDDVDKHEGYAKEVDKNEMSEGDADEEADEDEADEDKANEEADEDEANEEEEDDRDQADEEVDINEEDEGEGEGEEEEGEEKQGDEEEVNDDEEADDGETEKGNDDDESDEEETGYGDEDDSAGADEDGSAGADEDGDEDGSADGNEEETSEGGENSTGEADEKATDEREYDDEEEERRGGDDKEPGDDKPTGKREEEDADDKDEKVEGTGDAKEEDATADGNEQGEEEEADDKNEEDASTEGNGENNVTAEEEDVDEKIGEEDVKSGDGDVETAEDATSQGSQVGYGDDDDDSVDIVDDGGEVDYVDDCSSEVLLPDSEELTGDWYLLHLDSTEEWMRIMDLCYGCTLDCGEPTLDLILVSNTMIEHEQLMKPVLSLRKEIIDYCFLHDDDDLEKS